MNWRQDKTILVVDDDVKLLVALEKRLSSAGYRVATSTCGTEAFRRARAGDIDAITLDVGLLDQIDGLDVAAALSQSAETSNIPIIFITGRTDEHFRRKYKSVGGRFFLSKPFDSDLLIKTLDGVFGRDELARMEELSRAKRRQPAC